MGFLAVLLLALPLIAGTEEPADQEFTEKYFWVDTATVVSVDPEKGSLTVTEPREDVTYLVDEATLIRRGNETIPLRELSAGDRLAISAHVGQKVRGVPVADTVTVVITNPETGMPEKRSP
jgi:hypothetical protein